ncbi:major facilitator family transporter [Neisseria gonorrhoeae]|uniref:Major facilitator family transporter n=1 Tax=Neisseria gonorrhoeae TaxID=485 RepID=A0A378VY65_NEIGO|nr:major facilitator family transporter [Neisseria gonorrhoeae]
MFDSISLLYLIVALGNIPLAVFLIKRERRFLGAAAIRKNLECRLKKLSPKYTIRLPNVVNTL